MPLNLSFHDDALSAACGFDVFDFFGGNADITLDAFGPRPGRRGREIIVRAYGNDLRVTAGCTA